MSFEYMVTTSKSIDQSVAAITAALKEQGFGNPRKHAHEYYST